MSSFDAPLFVLSIVCLVSITKSVSPRGPDSKVHFGIDHERIFNVLLHDDIRKRVLGFRNYEEMHKNYPRIHHKTSYLEKHGIKFDDEEISLLTWTGYELKTTDIDWECLAKFKALRSLDLSMNQLSGVLDDIVFPPSLHHLVLRDNQLCGRPSQISCIALKKLPRELEVLWLHRNKFHGPVRFNDLPRGIKNVNMGQNKLYGHIDCSALPATLEKLCLVGCWFTGGVSATSDPKPLMDLDPYRFSI